MKLQNWLEQAPFTLSLSSGFFGFFCHVGFMKALKERDLAPTKYTGASAGALISAGLASGVTVSDLEKLTLSLRLSDFWDPAVGFGFVRGQKLEDLLAQHMSSNFSKLEKPLHIATFDIFKAKTVTFSAGEHLPKIVRASAAMPIMFHPVKIESRFYWDGGIRDKMAVQGLVPSERVLCNYLVGDGLHDSYERWSDNKKSSEVFKIIALEKIPRTGPKKLHLGPEIIEAAYKQTRTRLDQEI
jgi:NTE family protein